MTNDAIGNGHTVIGGDDDNDELDEQASPPGKPWMARCRSSTNTTSSACSTDRQGNGTTTLSPSVSKAGKSGTTTRRMSEQNCGPHGDFCVMRSFALDVITKGITGICNTNSAFERIGDALLALPRYFKFGFAKSFDFKVYKKKIKALVTYISCIAFKASKTSSWMCWMSPV